MILNPHESGLASNLSLTWYSIRHECQTAQLKIKICTQKTVFVIDPTSKKLKYYGAEIAAREGDEWLTEEQEERFGLFV